MSTPPSTGVGITGRSTVVEWARQIARQHLRGVRDWVRAKRFSSTVSWVSGPRTVKASPEDLVVVCLVRNGALYMPEFLHHYRDLGARHVVFLDNGSTDGTADLANGSGDVTVFRTAAPYKIYKDMMKRWLVERFGPSNWVLCVDIDEFFDYPFRKDVSLPAFLRYLNEGGFTAVVAQLLDMFPEGAITSSTENWRQEHRYYDLRHVERVSYASFCGTANVVPAVEIEVMRGGIRDSAFEAKVFLTKHPLLYPSAGITYQQAHLVSGARVADVSAVLLHYKYVGDVIAFVKSVVHEESYFANSIEYKKYLQVLEDSPDLRLYSAGATEFTSVEKLLDEGFLVASNNYRSNASAGEAP